MEKICMQPLDGESISVIDGFKEYITKCRARNLSEKTKPAVFDEICGVELLWAYWM